MEIDWSRFRLNSAEINQLKRRQFDFDYTKLYSQSENTSYHRSRLVVLGFKCEKTFYFALKGRCFPKLKNIQMCVFIDPKGKAEKIYLASEFLR